MSDASIESSATEEAGSIPTGASDHEKQEKDERRGFLSSAMRNLTEEELDSAAGRRFLIAEIQRLDRETDDAKRINQKYNDLRVEIASLTEKSKREKWLEILSFVPSTIGAAGIGAAPSYMTAAGLQSVGWVFAIGSAILVLTGVLFRVMK